MARERTDQEMADGWREIVDNLRAAIQEPTATSETYARFEAAKQLWYMYDRAAMIGKHATPCRARR